MAESDRANTQQQQQSRLVEALGPDEGLRARFQPDVRGVIDDDRLSELLPASMPFEAAAEAAVEHDSQMDGGEYRAACA
jgi:hypothetical protein